MGLPKHGHGGGGHHGGGGGFGFSGFAESFGEIGELFTTKHGLKEVAHAAAGGDPFAATVTGLALGVTGFGVKLGVKGAKGTFNGLKSVLGGKPKKSLHEDIVELGEKQEATLDPVREILDKGLITNKGIIGEVDNKIGMLIESIKGLKIVNENTKTTTNTNLLKLHRDLGKLAEADKKDIYFKKKTEVEQSKQTKLLEKQDRDRRRQRTVVPKAAAASQTNAFNLLGLDKLITTVKRGFALLFTAKGISAIFGAISSAFTKAIGFVGGLLVRSLPKLLGKAFKLMFKGVVIFNLITSLFGGITEAAKQWAQTGSFKQAIFGFIGGIMDTLSFGFLKSDDLVKTMNRMWEDMGAIWNNIGEFVSNAWDWLVPKVKSAGEFAFTFIVDKWKSFFTTISEIFGKVVEFLRLDAIKRIEKIPAGKLVSRILKTDEEKAREDYDAEHAKLIKERERIQRGRQSIKDGAYKGRWFDASDGATRLLNEEEAELARRVAKLAKSEIHKNMNNRERVQEAVKKSDAAMAKQGTQVINVAPVVSANAQTQNNTSNFSVPMSVRNSERTIDRVSAGHR